ncbi:alpha/beta fold hydrolase [Hymenobacter sp. DH14]|uniref:Alpha/beta fold hydrolase n=1 Tax=Hymenobacter cyanobacteriorum TaxID=2926463 RepID=A0A9X2AJS9_9BACT|nr:alpha/beta hydrolase [Hymenobacter cyanobacteriorum]MCI1189189.1 alpha/beta fold hydrolase [Hymenobacter cyanobacteriorum]
MKYTCLLALLAIARAGLAQTPAAPAAATDAPGLAGLWQGPLSIPGGSLPVAFAVQQPAANKLIATLDLPARRMSRLPVSVTLKGDSVVFFAAKANCRYACVLANGGQELRGTWVQPGLRVPLALRRAAVQPAGAGATAAAPVATTYHIEAVTVTSPAGNVALAGTLSIPDGPGPFPAAVLLSDMGGQDRDARQGRYRLFADIATSMARQGIAVLRLDDRGVGQSGGDSRQATTADLVRDAQAALSYLRVRSSIDPARTGFIGHGEGGNVALLAAAQPQPPSFVVGLAAAGLGGLELLAAQAEPATPADTARAGVARRQALADIAAKAKELRASGSNSAQIDTYVAQQTLKLRSAERKQAEAMLKFRRAMFEIVRQTANREQAQAIVANMLRQRYPEQDAALTRSRVEGLTTPWYRYYLTFDPQPTLAQVQCPVLLLNGTDDAEVNAATNLTALEKGLKTNKRVTTRRLPGVQHWFQTPAAELIPNADGTVDPVVSAAMLDAVRDWVLGLSRQ